MDYEMLVNKKNKLSASYTPEGLIKVPNEFYIRNTDRIDFALPKVKITKIFFDNFLKLYEIAKDDLNIRLYINSGYRSFPEQTAIYAKSLIRNGLEETKRKVALPGTSEHQTGLAADFTKIVNGKNKDLTDQEADDLFIKGAPLGFIMRYLKDKENTTGYSYEPWHFRYVGPRLAKLLLDKNWTLEEYKEKERNHSL